MATRLIKSACRMCRRACGIDIRFEGDKITKVAGTVENPLSKGVLCPKGKAIIEFINSTHRLRYPLKIDNGTQKRIEWDEAFDTIAHRLEKVKQEHGAKSLAVYIGESASQCDAVSYVRRFLDLYGSPNLFTGGSLCFRPIPIACSLTFGKTFVPEPVNSRCIVIWGIEPHNSNHQQATQIMNARKAGAKIIVIDPRSPFFARRAELHIQPKPGSDCLLVLAMMNVIISNELYDKSFVENWTVGFDDLRRHVANYPPEKVEKATAVPGRLINEAAVMFARNKPASIIPGAALFHQIDGVHTIRAISILQALTGNVDVSGGWISMPELPLEDLSLPDKINSRPLGEDKYPLFVGTGRRLEGQAAVLTDAILDEKPYPIKAMFIAGGNPALSWPDSAKVVRALKMLDFLVVMDTTMTMTAELADIVLPAATFMETTELHNYREAGIPYAILRKKSTEFPECMPDWKFWFELAKRMDFQDYFPWLSEEEAIGFSLAPSRITISELKVKFPEGVFYSAKQYETYKQKGFPTPSGKVEFYSSRLKDMGYSPLPVAQLPLESEEYPLLLITGARHLEYTHSQFRYVCSLSKRVPEPVAEIHPETADRYDIADGRMLHIETEKGKLMIKARITEGIMPDVVSIPLGWAQANVNELTRWENPDPICGLPTLVGLPCKARPA